MKLMIYTDPHDAITQLQHDAGFVVDGKPDSYNNREGQSFELPESMPSGWGARLVISKNGFVSVMQRGIVYAFDDRAVFLADDFTLTKYPDPIIIEKPVEVPSVPSYPTDPFGIIKLVYKLGQFDLSKKEDCGKFTEAVCAELHKNHSNYWGHIRKFGAQNQFNGHAVDAIFLLKSVGSEPNITKSGVYDLVLDSESLNAKPQFIYKGDTDPSLWYYPA